MWKLLWVLKIECKINFQQKFSVVLDVGWRSQTDCANGDLGELALELDLKTNLNLSYKGVPERFRWALDEDLKGDLCFPFTSNCLS